MKRYLPYLVALVVLGGINLLRWRTSVPMELAAAAVPERFAVADYRVRATSASAPEDVQSRDLFYGESRIAPPRTVTPRAHPVAPPEPPQKTPEQLAEETARTELASLRVTGIAFRAGKGQAYITSGEESYVVKTGDRIANRFDVLEITSEYVSLKDPATSVGAKVPLQGE